MDIINSAVAVTATLLGLVTASVLHNDNLSHAGERVVLVQHAQPATRSIDVILRFVVRTQPAPTNDGMPVR
jgi:hypothetical protein